jgi:hypothetical protein
MMRCAFAWWCETAIPIAMSVWKLTGRGEHEWRHPSRTYVRTLVKLGVSEPRHGRILILASAVGRIVRSMVALDRVEERRRAVALARHYRDEESLSIAEIARRLGRAEPTVKAYLYDPSDANKGPSWEREAEPGGRELRSHSPAAASRGDVLPRRTFSYARLAVQHRR